MVTAGTYGKLHLFDSRKRLRFLTELMMDATASAGWLLEAWSIFSNHYHFIGKSPQNGAASLITLIASLHRKSAIWLNRLDGTSGRKVWHNYWDTELSYERSYLARLHYVMHNPVKHGLVKSAHDYPWCSAGWFRNHASHAFVKTVEAMPLDRVKVWDEF